MSLKFSLIQKNVLKLFFFFFKHCDCCSLVHKTQINLASMAASGALSTSMILNSRSHNNACDQPQDFTAIKPPWHAQFIIHFALSNCSQRDLHVALVLVCEDALWHRTWCTFYSSHSRPTWRERREERTWHTNVGNLVCGWHPLLWINDLNAC